MKTIVFCRHAKSDWPAGVPDIDRPLKGRGRKDAKRLGALLNEHDFKPDLMVSSPANRALTTAKVIAAEVDYPEDQIRIESTVYYSGSDGLLRLVQGLPDNKDVVMLFGHNPAMENVVSELLGLGNIYQMPTAGMVCLETYSAVWADIRPDNIGLRWLLVPRLKRKEL